MSSLPQIGGKCMRPYGHHDILSNDIQHNDTQYNDNKVHDTQHNNKKMWRSA